MPTEDMIVQKAKQLAEEAPQVNQEVPETYDVVVDRVEPRVVQRWRGKLGKIFGKKKNVIEYVTIQETVQKIRMVNKLVRASFEAFLEIARQQLQPPPTEYYLEEARKIKSEEIRNDLLKKNIIVN